MLCSSFLRFALVRLRRRRCVFADVADEAEVVAKTEAEAVDELKDIASAIAHAALVAIIVGDAVSAKCTCKISIYQRVSVYLSLFVSERRRVAEVTNLGASEINRNFWTDLTCRRDFNIEITANARCWSPAGSSAMLRSHLTPS